MNDKIKIILKTLLFIIVLFLLAGFSWNTNAPQNSDISVGHINYHVRDVPGSDYDDSFGGLGHGDSSVGSDSGKTSYGDFYGDRGGSKSSYGDFYGDSDSGKSSYGDFYGDSDDSGSNDDDFSDFDSGGDSDGDSGGDGGDD
jgi:hypothetical protein